MTFWRLSAYQDDFPGPDGHVEKVDERKLYRNLSELISVGKRNVF